MGQPAITNKHYKKLENSSYFWIAIDKQTGDDVGFVRAISDEIISSYIPLLEVLPEYQGGCIGKKLMENMLTTLRKFYMIDLLCNQDLQGCYSKFEITNSQGMVFRNYENQNGI